MTSARTSRRAFLRGEPRAATPVRPPWSLPEIQFTDHCTRCGDCATACPEDLIVRGDAGFPEVDFLRGECTFCGRCADACNAAAFGPRDASPWHLRLTIRDDCLAQAAIHCEVCRDACPTAALRFAPRVPVPIPILDAERCSGCGACIASCPVGAIGLSPEIAA
jgi:ferredoxin-type protein NapF